VAVVWLTGNGCSLSPDSLEIKLENIIDLTKNLQYGGHNFISENIAHFTNLLTQTQLYKHTFSSVLFILIEF
jgi:hypothetical protein